MQCSLQFGQTYCSICVRRAESSNPIESPTKNVILSCGYLESLIDKSFSMRNYKVLQINQQILKAFYLWCLHIIQTLIYET